MTLLFCCGTELQMCKPPGRRSAEIPGVKAQCAASSIAQKVSSLKNEIGVVCSLQILSIFI